MESSHCNEILRFVLQNEMLLEHIFSFLNREELNASRLVSQHWYTVSLPLWLKRQPQIRLSAEPRWYSNCTISDFLRLFHNASKQYATFEYRAIRQFKNFTLEFGNPSRLHTKILNQFLINCGTWIRHLTLEWFNFEDLLTFQNVFYCSYTPNLERLNVSWCNFYFEAGPDENGDGGPVTFNESGRSCAGKHGVTGVKYLSIGFDSDQLVPIHDWRSFLTHYPKLKILRISYIPDNEVWKLLDSIKQIRATDKNKMALTNLDLYDGTRKHYELPSRLLSFYLDSQLPLEHLDVYGLENITPADVNALISLNLKCLRSLKIYNEKATWEERLDPYLIGLENLCSLEMGGPVIWNLNVLERFPYLNKLTLRSHTEADLVDDMRLISASIQGRMDGVMLHSLKEFAYCYKEICGPMEIQRIKSWMPNLTTLEIAVTNDGFNEVCKSWPMLESITVEIGLTGDDYPVEFQEMELNIPLHFPKSMRTLKYLRNLHMKAYYPFYAGGMGLKRQLVAEELQLDFKSGK